MFDQNEKDIYSNALNALSQAKNLSLNILDFTD
jgi:hypothetical protein